MFCSVRVERKSPKIERWNDEVADAVERKEVAWKAVLGTKNECEKKYV